MEFPLPLLLGAGTLAAILWGRSRKPSNAAGGVPEEGEALAGAASGVSARSGKAPFLALPGKWTWPVPITRGRVPVISSGWGSPRGDRQHEGVDVMFRRLPSDPYPVRSPNGSKLFVMPDDVLAVAAADGVIWSAGKTPRGWSVVIDHSDALGHKLASYYTHLEEMFVKPTSRARSGEQVKAGQPLGIIGADPLDGNHLKHLHFALWAGGSGDAFDAAPFMKSWAMVKDPREGGTPSSAPGTSQAGTTGAPGGTSSGGGAGSSFAATSAPVPPPALGVSAATAPGGPLVAADLAAGKSYLPGAGPPAATLSLTLSPSAAMGRSYLAPEVAQARRNAKLAFRPVGASGERYPAWVRQLRGKSGVYFIRERSSEDADPELVYIGQSGAGRLYETLTRHLQGWRRFKGFWRGQYAEGHDPGLTYPRDRVEVAVRVTSPERALEEEARFIRKLRPRDNVIGQLDDLSDVPF